MKSTIIANKFASVMRTIQAGPIRSTLFFGVFMGLIFLRDTISHLGMVIGMSYATLILFTLWAPSSLATRILAWAASLLIVAGYVFVPPDMSPAFALITRLLGIGVVWVMAALVLDRNALVQDRDQARQRVQILEGLLPICAECRKIRDDAGGWTDIEIYVSNHSKAQFTHALCTPCIRKLYPDKADEIIRDMAQYKT